MKQRFLKLIVVALSVGGFIYLFLRPANLYLHSWIANSVLSSFLDATRAHLVWAQEITPVFVLYNLPDGLFFFAITLAALLLWQDQRGAWAAFMRWSIPLVMLLHEPMQYLGLLKGTFDVLDIFFQLIAFLWALMFIRPINVTYGETNVARD